MQLDYTIFVGLVAGLLVGIAGAWGWIYESAWKAGVHDGFVARQGNYVPGKPPFLERVVILDDFKPTHFFLLAHDKRWVRISDSEYESLNAAGGHILLALMDKLGVENAS